MPVDDMNFDGFDVKLYFHDGFEWKEVGNLEKIHELSTEILNTEGEEAIFAYLVPNNWRRMHGFKARRRSVEERRAERKVTKGFYCK